ncbi:MAG: hypothetical protein DRJ97_02400 [Thermoprotei archaeon]|nr:MAG: hypothetical protein DRJ97_02400 [Thermoprotei archaeon]
MDYDDLVMYAVIDCMKCSAQATAILASSLESFAQRVDNQIGRLYALYVSLDLKKFNFIIREILKELGSDPDEPPRNDCRTLLGSALSDSIAEALRLLKGGHDNVDSLVKVGLRIIELSTIHALAHSKAIELLKPSRSDLAQMLKMIVKDLKRHSRMLVKVGFLVRGAKRSKVGRRP